MWRFGGSSKSSQLFIDSARGLFHLSPGPILLAISQRSHPVISPRLLCYIPGSVKSSQKRRLARLQDEYRCPTLGSPNVTHHSKPCHIQTHSNGFPSIRTDNPLDDIESSELEADVTAFHSNLSLDTVVDLRTLINGARLAKDRLRNVPSGLTPAELETISRESSEKYLSFLQTRGLLVTVMATACAAITQYVHHACQLGAWL